MQKEYVKICAVHVLFEIQMHRGKEFILFIVAQQYFSEIWINFVEEKFIEFIKLVQFN